MGSLLSMESFRVIPPSLQKVCIWLCLCIGITVDIKGSKKFYSSFHVWRFERMESISYTEKKTFFADVSYCFVFHVNETLISLASGHIYGVVRHNIYFLSYFRICLRFSDESPKKKDLQCLKVCLSVLHSVHSYYKYEDPSYSCSII